MPKVLSKADFGIGKPGEESKDTPPEKDDAVVGKDGLIGGGPGDTEIGEKKESEKPEDKKDAKKGKETEADKGKVVPKFKYANQEEAEKAIREAEKRMHKATEEAAMIRKALLEQNLKRSENQNTLSEEEKIADETILEIGKLDTEDKEYDKKCARIWAKANRKIVQLEFSQESSKKDREQAATSDLEAKVDKALEDAAFTSEWDKKAFAVMANYVPKNIIDQDEQIEWVLGQIGEYRKTILGEHEERTKQEEKARQDLKVLGTGSNKRASIKEPEPEPHQRKTLGEQMRELKAKRKLAS